MRRSGMVLASSWLLAPGSWLLAPIRSPLARWRVAVALVLLAAVGLPAGLPFLELFRDGHGWRAWTEPARLLALTGNTLGLVAGVLALAVPAGILGAVLLYRTDLPLRRGLRFLALVGLFVPLPLFTSAWQAALGSSGWLPVLWGTAERVPAAAGWRPWEVGLGAAVWVQALASLPWVVVLVGQGLCWVERELEEDALTATGPWQVLWRVTLPRSRAAVYAAGLWVALLAGTEITVTDAMQVRTFAEEVYTQFVGDQTGLARAVAVSLLPAVLFWGLVLWTTRRWERDLPPLESLRGPAGLIPLGRARWPCLVGALLVVAVLAGVPVVSLVWKTGLAGSPPAWSARVAGTHLAAALRVRGGMVLESLVLAGVAGGVAAGLGLVVCWLALGAAWFRAGVLSLMAAVWALAGPVLGIGLKETIAGLITLTGSRRLAVALYYGPSPLPVVWADLVRFFPCAVALLWPVVRLFPSELRDAARVDGAGPGQELWRVVLPLTAAAGVRAAFAIAILSLGELAAGKLVETPGSQTFAHEVFTQMHFGVTNDLAALCLVLLAVVALAASLFGLIAAGLGLVGGEW